MPATRVLDRDAGDGLTQEANDMLFGEPLPRVQSPGQLELDSRSASCSEPGGRRLTLAKLPLSVLFL